MNYIVWQMPFTLFGFALCGLLVETALTVRRQSSLNSQKKIRTRNETLSSGQSKPPALSSGWKDRVPTPHQEIIRRSHGG
jgi:hypothetical protein